MHSREPVSFIAQMAKTPHILRRALQALYVKHVSIPREYKRDDGRALRPPQQISVKITDACNLRCKTCGQWGETGYNFARSATDLKRLVPVERYLQLADDMRPFKPLYYIWGGEPYLYSGLFEFTERIKRNDSLLAVVTNATCLEERAKDAVEQKWDVLMFSIDGPEAVHDEIRGREGTFQKVAAGIERVQRYKREKKTRLPWVMALVTVSVGNAAWLDKIFEVGEALGVDCMIVYFSWFTNEAIGRAHTEIFERKFGITPTRWRGFLFDHNVDTQALTDSLERIRARKWKFQHLFIPNLREPGDLAEYYRNPGNFFGYGPCISTWFVAEVMPNGDVAPCRDYPDYITGNLMEESIFDIWNGERYRKFRLALKDNGGTFPICSRCCGLMGW
jgi:radical SAM protein with 4Fe4S-binding SPASM domain